jgi:hypothetical protein
VQKDAIMIAVLKEQGGIFMDVDTLAFRDISPIVRKLNETEAVMFGSHVAFLATRPHSRVLARCLGEIQARLDRLEGRNDAELRLPWDYMAGSRTRPDGCRVA